MCQVSKGAIWERRYFKQRCTPPTPPPHFRMRPNAKMAQTEGSLAVPMLRDGAVIGTLGVANPRAHEPSSEETSLLMAVGAMLAQPGQPGRDDANP